MQQDDQHDTADTASVLARDLRVDASEVLLLRVNEATARLVGLKSTKRLYAWIRAGVIPSHVILRVGVSIYLKRPALVLWATSSDGTKPSRTAGKR